MPFHSKSTLIIYFCSHWSASPALATASRNAAPSLLRSLVGVLIGTGHVATRESIVEVHCTLMNCHGRSIIVRAFMLWLRINLRISLTHLLHSWARILEREILPGQMISPKAQHVLYTLGAWSAEESLCSKHRIVDIAVTLQRHKEIIEVLQVLLQQLMCLIIFDFVSELIDKIVDKVIQPQQACLECLQSIDIGLFQELVVEVGHANFAI